MPDPDRHPYEQFRPALESGRRKTILAFRALVTPDRFDTARRKIKRHIKSPRGANDNRLVHLTKQAA